MVLGIVAPWCTRSVFPSLCLPLLNPPPPAPAPYLTCKMIPLGRWSEGYRVDPDSKKDGSSCLAARPGLVICIYYTVLGGGSTGPSPNSCLSHGFVFWKPPTLLCLPLLYTLVAAESTTGQGLEPEYRCFLFVNDNTTSSFG